MGVRILALESSGAACSAAFYEDGRLRARRFERRARGQAERLMPMVTEVAAEAGAELASVDLFAATVGPGAFTGLRIGLATLRGLALSAHRPMLGVTSLEAIAHGTTPEERSGRRLLVLIESRRSELYAQSFASDLAPLDAPRAVPAATLAEAYAGERLLLAGDAAARAEAELNAAGCELTWSSASDVPDAAIVATLAAARVHLARTAPPAPLYLRPADTTLPPRHTGALTIVPAIVQAGAAHAELLAALHAASLADAWPASGFLELLRHPNSWALVAQATAPDPEIRAPLGFILCRSAGDECEILTIATAPDARRRGIASALLRAALDSSRDRGAQAAYLEVAADNVAAQALYRRAGFTAVGQRPAYYRNIRGRGAKDALVLRRPIPDKRDGY